MYIVHFFLTQGVYDIQNRVLILSPRLMNSFSFPYTMDSPVILLAPQSPVPQRLDRLRPLLPRALPLGLLGLAPAPPAPPHLAAVAADAHVIEVG